MSVRFDTSVRVERRSGIDRRVSRPSLRRQLFGTGLRVQMRRGEDRHRLNPVDRYGGDALFALLMVILILSITDAFLTLVLLERGAVEINPIMDYYIGVGARTFVIVKYLLTVLPLIILLFTKEFLSERYGIARLLPPSLIAAVFAGVVIWELHLLGQIPA